MSSHQTPLNGLNLSIAVLIGAVIISGSIIYASRSGGSATVIRAEAPVALSAPSAPTNQNLNVKEISVSGSPVVGSASAPILAVYWYDYQCPFCKRIEENGIRNLMADYVSTGKMRIVFKDLQFLGPDSTKLGLAGRAVWEVAPSKYYDWHKAIYENQGPEHSGWATDDFIRKISAGVLGSSSADRVMSLMVSKASAYQSAIDADKKQANDLGIASTPTMVIGTTAIRGAQGYDSIKAAVESALKK